MMNLFGLSQAEIETFLLVFVRCTTIITLLPIFGATQIPALVRIGLGFLVSFVVFKSVPPMPVFTGLDQMFLAIISQLVVGLLFAFVTQMVFMGVQFAGQILDLQIGFAVANVINPTTQQQVTIIGELQLALATLIFLISDSHLAFFQGIGGSFQLLPLPWIQLSDPAQASIVTFFTQALLIVFRIAAPAAITMFIVSLSIAFLARVAPQMNVFVIGFPIQIMVGFTMLILTMPLLGYALPGLFGQVPRQLDTLMRSLAPG